MYIKIHQAYRPVVSICDKELMGKTFKQGKLCIYVRESFFKGEEKNEEEIIEMIKDGLMEDATFNIVGKKSIDTALKCNLISKHGIINIQDIPVALVLI